MNTDFYISSFPIQAVFRVGDSSGSEDDDDDAVDTEDVGLQDDRIELGGNVLEADPMGASSTGSDSDV